MAIVVKDRVKQTAAAPGTGTITLGSTPTGFQAFSAIGNGNVTYFAIVDNTSGAWEVNYGTYTSSGTTLSRNATPLSSSTGTLVNFTNAVDVFVTYPSENAVWTDTSGVVAQTSFGAITATSAALTTGTISTAPTTNTDIVNKQYADAIASGIHFHEAVELATTAALPANTYNNGTSGVGATLTANANGALSVDSTLTVVGYRILVKNEVTQANNGVYTVTQVGSAGTPYILTRAADFNTAGTGVNQIDEGDFFLVTSGTVNANTAWVQQTPPPIVVGTTALVFQQFAAPITYTAGTGLNESPTYTFNIANTTVTAATYGSASAVPVFAVNAQGQLTSVTDTSIAINGSAVSGAISGQAGSVANALTLGTYLTGTSFNGSAAVTATVDATSANTASKVVARDVSGNFAAGTITAALTGNASTATAATNISGGAANQIVYNTAAATTAFAAAPSASGQLLGWNGSAFSWVGTVPTTSGGTGLTSFTSGGVVYASSTSALATGSALVFDGTNLSVNAATATMKTVDPATGYSFFSASNTNGSFYFGVDNAAGSFFGNANARVLYASGAYPMVFNVNSVEIMRLDTSANLLVGATTPYGGSGKVFKLQTAGAKTYSEGVPVQGISSVDTTAMAAGVGGSIVFTGKYDTTGNYTMFAGIEGQKTNATSGNYAGDMVFKTRVNGGNLTEYFRIANTGAFGLTGANYGTSGQVLTSGGSAAAPTWSSIAGGDATNNIGYLNIPQNAQTGSYTLVLADSGKHIYHATGAGAATYTIPANGSVAYPIGTAVSFVNLSTTSISIAITTDTMYLGGTGTTGTRTLANYGTATALKVTSTVWIITGSGLT
jgi:hypothetical protein